MQEALVKALFRAYFSEGRNLSHTPTPLDVGPGVGSFEAAPRRGCGVTRG